MPVTAPRPADSRTRADELALVLAEWRAMLMRPVAPGDEDRRRIDAVLFRIQRLSTMLQAETGRTEADPLDEVLTNLLLGDYTDLVHALRSSAREAAARLGSVAEIVAAGDRDARAERRKLRKASS
jgi:hypothetical protein